MRMLEPNATNNNPAVLSAQAAQAAGSLNNNGAGLLPNPAVPPQMQTTINGNTATTDRLDASSDSAVSSMGSERVPSLSDGEWGDTGSDSAQEYHHRYESIHKNLVYYNFKNCLEFLNNRYHLQKIPRKKLCNFIRRLGKILSHCLFIYLQQIWSIRL